LDEASSYQAIFGGTVLRLNVKPHTLVQILLASDLMPSLSIPESSLGPGVDDPELQERCQESGFQDRLVGLGLE